MQGSHTPSDCQRPFVSVPKPMLQSASRRVVARIKIDRRRHMEIAWKRQQQLELEIDAELKAGPLSGSVWEVRGLGHLEKIHEASKGRIVVMLAYNRSCGCCKRAIEFLEAMKRQVCIQAFHVLGWNDSFRDISGTVSSTLL